MHIEGIHRGRWLRRLFVGSTLDRVVSLDGLRIADMMDTRREVRDETATLTINVPETTVRRLNNRRLRSI